MNYSAPCGGIHFNRRCYYYQLCYSIGSGRGDQDEDSAAATAIGTLAGTAYYW